MDTLLEISDVSVALPANADRPFAVKNASFGLRAGEVVCVVGESGSGKSTIAHAILGLLPRGLAVSAGSILFGSTDLVKLGTRGLRRVRGKRIGMIFQEPLSALNPLMRCGRQIEEVLEEHESLQPAALQSRVRELLLSVGLTDHERMAASYPHQLSGGQRQRVMIAMALALEPEVLIADEPTTALDVTTQAQIIQLILDIQKRKGLAVLFITHDFGVVSEIADRVVVMKEGRIVESGATDEVLSNPKQAYTKALLAAVPALLPPSTAANARPDSPALLSIKGLSKTYTTKKRLFGDASHFPALKNVSFDIHAGEVVGLVGESGSGKSTLGRIVAGLVQADHGQVLLDDANVLAEGAFRNKALRYAIQMVFQDPYGSLNPRHSVRKILTGGMRLVGMGPDEALAKARELLHTVSLDPSALDRFPHEFSGGQRQRLGFARAIAVSPKLIVADEPVSALDVSVQEQVLAMLKSLKERLQLSILFITHDLRVAAQLCDKIVVLKHGVAVEQGPTAQVLTEPKNDYTRKLIAAIPGRGWK